MDPQYHPKIIGRKGERVKKIREEHDVIIQFPRENESEQNITIIGYEKAAEAAKETILNIVREYVSNTNSCLSTRVLWIIWNPVEVS